MEHQRTVLASAGAANTHAYATAMDQCDLHLDPETADAAQIGAVPARRTRRFLGRRLMDHEPRVRRYFVGGEEFVAVELGGRLGVGKEARLNAEDWDQLAATHGTRWTIMRSGKHLFVASGRSVAGASAGQRCERPVGVMRRIVAGTTSRKDAVRHINGDFLDHRRFNLEVVDRIKLAKPYIEAARAKRRANAERARALGASAGRAAHE